MQEFEGKVTQTVSCRVEGLGGLREPGHMASPSSGFLVKLPEEDAINLCKLVSWEETQCLEKLVLTEHVLTGPASPLSFRCVFSICPQAP